MKTRNRFTPIAWIIVGALVLLLFTGVALAAEPYPLTEEFNSPDGFQFFDPGRFTFSNGWLQAFISRGGNRMQFAYRSIPPFSGDVRLTVGGRIDNYTNNCNAFAGIGKLQEPLVAMDQTGIAISFGFYGGGCSTQGPMIGADGVWLNHNDAGCAFTGSWLWVQRSVPYTAVLTVTGNNADLTVDGVGSVQGTRTYNGEFDTLFVGRPGDGDWPTCTSSIDYMKIEPLGQGQPPTADAGGPYTVKEGESVLLQGAGQDPYGGALVYAWDLDNNGTFETPGQSAAFSAAGLDGPGTYPVTVQVTAAGGLAATSQATVNVVNVPPTATFDAPASVNEGGVINLSLTNPSDPSLADVAAGFSYAFDCGDGSGYGAFGAGNSAQCPAPDTGTRTVGGMIRDKDGATTTFADLWQETFTYPDNTVPGDIDFYAAEGSVHDLKVIGGKLRATLDTPSYSSYAKVAWSPAGITFDKQDAVTIEFEGYEKTGYLAGNNYGGFEINPSSLDLSRFWGPVPYQRLIFGTQNRYTSSINGDCVDSNMYGTRFAPDMYSAVDGTHLYRLEMNNVAGVLQIGAVRFYRDGVLEASYDQGDRCLTQENKIQFFIFGGDPYGATYTWDNVRISKQITADSTYTAAVIIANVPPTVNTPAVVAEPSDEGSAVMASATFSDPGAHDAFSCAIDYGDGTGNWPGSVSGTTCTGPAHTYADDGTFTVTVSVNDKDGGVGSSSVAHVVNNVPPTVGPITAPIYPVQVNTVIAASADFTDPGILDTYTALWNWGDGTTSAGTVTEANGSVTGSHTYTAAGVYTVRLTVTDGDGSSGQSVFQYIVVFDPSGGFVTGGGWFNSPIGAYSLDPSLQGKATFGFVSRYRKGAAVPDGTTEFQFSAGNLNFHSDSYEWLVIAGPKAQYKGTGTINGQGNYGFMLTAVDGDLIGGADRFRIKVWDKATGTVIYDNQNGASDTADPATDMEGGSIVIHR